MNIIEPKKVITSMKTKNISEEILQTIKYSGIDINAWLSGFECAFESARESVDKI